MHRISVGSSAAGAVGVGLAQRRPADDFGGAGAGGDGERGKKLLGEHGSDQI